MNLVNVVITAIVAMAIAICLIGPGREGPSKLFDN
jgi:hypothetical protein